MHRGLPGVATIYAYQVEEMEFILIRQEDTNTSMLIMQDEMEVMFMKYEETGFKLIRQEDIGYMLIRYKEG